MNRKQAIQIICENLKDEIVISANGYISRDLFSTLDRKFNFYMIGSMGLASSIGLGVAIKNKRKTTIIFDGDGNILMNLGSLVTIGTIKPKNLIHIIFDNHSHESTGGQPTTTKKIKIEEIAKKTNYKIYQVKTKQQLKKIFRKKKKENGPIMVSIEISKTKNSSGRINLSPIEIKNRFMKSIET